MGSVAILKISFNLNYFLRGQSSKASAMEGKASAYEFWKAINF
jgi:hypothetical protein